MKKSCFVGSMLLMLAAVGAGAATVSGIVKVAGDAGAPIEGAKVILRSTRGNGGAQDSTVTNAAGQFSFTNVTTGFKVAQASKTGYQNSQSLIDVVSGTETYTTAISLTALPPPALPGSVTGTIHASTATGALLAGVQVIISSTSGGGGFGLTPIDTVLTNAQGIYTFPSIPAANNYFLRASLTGYVSITNNNVDVVANTTTTINLIMLPTPPPPPPGTVTGTVRSTSASGALIEGARVIISTPGIAGIGGKAIDTVFTNALGVYLINPVPVGDNYILNVSKVGFDPGTNTNVDVATAAAVTANFILTVNPNAGKPGSIAGTIRKNDSTMAAISGALVMLSRSGAKVDSFKTSTDGRYSFPNVEALQNYTITVSATGFTSATNNKVDVVANTTSTIDFKLDVSTTPKTMGRIMGVVTNETGKGIANATVVVFRSQGGGTRDTTTTDATGHYGIDSVLAGNAYTVMVSGANYQNAINSNVNVVAGQVVTADFILVASSTKVHGSSWVHFNTFKISMVQGRKTIEFSALPAVGKLSGFDVRGGKVFSSLVPSSCSTFELPMNIRVNYLVLERNGNIERLFVPMAFN